MSDRIDKAVAFMQSGKIASVSEEQRDQFLKEKFSEEEIAQIKKRLKRGNAATPT